MVSALFSYGPGLLSRGKTVTMPVGTSFGTLARLTSDNLNEWAGAVGTTATFVVDCAVPVTPHYMAIFGHNFTGVGVTVRFKGSASASLSSPVVNVVATVASPHFWSDFRALSFSAARYWGVEISGTAAAIKFAKVVVGTVDALRTPQWEFVNRDTYLERFIGGTDYGSLVRTKLGLKVRARSVRFIGPDTVEALFRAISRVAQRSPGFVVCVPQDDANDVWFLDWEDGYGYGQRQHNWREVKLNLTEQSAAGLT